MLFTVPVQIKAPGGPTGEKDELGNRIYAPDRIVDQMAWIDERTSEEAIDGRNQKTWGYWIHLPLDTPLVDDGVVVIDGVDYDVVGEPSRQPGGFLIAGYIRAQITRTEG